MRTSQVAIAYAFMAWVGVAACSQMPLSSSPERNAVKAPRCSSISLTWPQGTDMSELSSPGALVVRGSLDGVYGNGERSLLIQGNQVTFTPSCPFQPGERITVTVSADVGVAPATFQFHTAAETHGQGFFRKIDEHQLTQAGGAVPLGAGEWSIGLAVADLDGDHDVDLVVANRALGQLVVLLNDEGQGVFGVRQILPLPGVLDVALILNATDPDTARYDVVVTCYCDLATPAVNEVLRLMNDGTGSFTLGPAVLFNVPGAPAGRVQELTVVDVDQDGLDDVAVSYSWLSTNVADNGVALLRNVPGGGLLLLGQLAFDNPLPSPPTVEPRGLEAADLDLDWIMDLAIAAAGSLPDQWAGRVTRVLGPLDAQPAPTIVSATGISVLPFTIPGTLQTVPGGAVALRIIDLDPPPSGPGLPDIMALYRAVDPSVELGRTQLIYGVPMPAGSFGELPIPASADPTSLIWRQRDLLVAQFEDSLPQWDLVVGGRPQKFVNSVPTLGDFPTLGLLAIDDTQPPAANPPPEPPFEFPIIANFNPDPHGIGDSPRAFAAADVDGDGDLDLILVADGLNSNGMQETFVQIYSNGNTGPASVRFDDVAALSGLQDHAYILHFPPDPTPPVIGAPGQPNEHGPGLAVADFDQDGIDDLFLPHETQEYGPADPSVPAYDPDLNDPQVYHGTASGGFSRVTPDPARDPLLDPNMPMGLRCRLATGAAACDYDNDGFPDVYMICGSNMHSLELPPDPMVPAYEQFFQRLDCVRNVLFHNDTALPGGAITFTDVSSQTGSWPISFLPCNMEGLVLGTQPGILENMCWSVDASSAFQGVEMGDTTCAAWGDLNRDGLPDLFVGSLGGFAPGAYQRDALYIQKPDHTFFLYEIPLANHSDRSVTGSLNASATMYGETLACTIADLNGDGWPDIYVTNASFDGHVLYVNLGRSAPPAQPQGFDPWPQAAGGGPLVPFIGFDGISANLAQPGEPAACAAPGAALTPLAMGIAVGDLDGDGALDLYMTDKELPPTPVNDLFLLHPILPPAPVPPSFNHQCGLAPAAFSWGCTVQDHDNDGDLDIFVASNNFLPNYWYRNEGQPFSMRDMSGEALSLSTFESRGVVDLDYDRDGRMDLLVMNKTDPGTLDANNGIGNPPSLLHNITTNVGNFLKIKLQGNPLTPNVVGGENLFSTRDALNARIEVVPALPGGGVGVSMVREVIAYGSNAASTHTLVQHFGLGVATSVDHVTIKWPSGRSQTLSASQVNPFVQQVGQGLATVLAVTEPN